jgi:hypothetical protein
MEKINHLVSLRFINWASIVICLLSTLITNCTLNQSTADCKYSTKCDISEYSRVDDKYLLCDDHDKCTKNNWHDNYCKSYLHLIKNTYHGSNSNEFLFECCYQYAHPKQVCICEDCLNSSIVFRRLLQTLGLDSQKEMTTQIFEKEQNGCTNKYCQYRKIQGTKILKSYDNSLSLQKKPYEPNLPNLIIGIFEPKQDYQNLSILLYKDQSGKECKIELCSKCLSDNLIKDNHSDKRCLLDEYKETDFRICDEKSKHSHSSNPCIFINKEGAYESGRVTGTKVVLQCKSQTLKRLNDGNLCFCYLCRPIIENLLSGIVSNSPYQEHTDERCILINYSKDELEFCSETTPQHRHNSKKIIYIKKNDGRISVQTKTTRILDQCTKEGGHAIVRTVPDNPDSLFFCSNCVGVIEEMKCKDLPKVTNTKQNEIVNKCSSNYCEYKKKFGDKKYVNVGNKDFQENVVVAKSIRKSNYQDLYLFETINSESNIWICSNCKDTKELKFENKKNQKSSSPKKMLHHSDERCEIDPSKKIIFEMCEKKGIHNHPYPLDNVFIQIIRDSATEGTKLVKECNKNNEFYMCEKCFAPIQKITQSIPEKMAKREHTDDWCVYKKIDEGERDAKHVEFCKKKEKHYHNDKEIIFVLYKEYQPGKNYYAYELCTEKKSIYICSSCIDSVELPSDKFKEDDNSDKVVCYGCDEKKNSEFEKQPWHLCDGRHRILENSQNNLYHYDSSAFHLQQINEHHNDHKLSEFKICENNLSIFLCRDHLRRVIKCSGRDTNKSSIQALTHNSNFTYNPDANYLLLLGDGCVGKTYFAKCYSSEQNKISTNKISSYVPTTTISAFDLNIKNDKSIVLVDTPDILYKKELFEKEIIASIDTYGKALYKGILVFVKYENRYASIYDKYLEVICSYDIEDHEKEVSIILSDFNNYIPLGEGDPEFIKIRNIFKDKGSENEMFLFSGKTANSGELLRKILDNISKKEFQVKIWNNVRKKHEKWLLAEEAMEQSIKQMRVVKSKEQQSYYPNRRY